MSNPHYAAHDAWMRLPAVERLALLRGKAREWNIQRAAGFVKNDYGEREWQASDDTALEGLERKIKAMENKND